MKEIRKIIKEEIGIQMEIHSLSEIAIKQIIKDIEHDWEGLLKNKKANIITDINTDKNIKNKTKIDWIDIFLNIKIGDEFTFRGKFIPNLTLMNSNELYDTAIKLDLSITEDNLINLSSIEKEIEGVVSHELNHVFVHIKKINKINNSKILNAAKNKAKNLIGDILNENPALKEFVEMFYLSLPEEVQARVQEIGTFIKHSTYETHQEVMKEVMQTKIAFDASRMIKYKPNFPLTDENKDFISKFNNYIQSEIKAGETPPIINENNFFNYWTKVFNNSGNKLFNKIMKVVANKHIVDEGTVYLQLDEFVHYNVYGKHMEGF